MAAVEPIPRSNNENKKNSRAKVDIDRISHLPPDVVDNIIRFLPLMDAAKTSLLSTHWRYKWAYHPELILDTHILDIPKLKEFKNKAIQSDPLRMALGAQIYANMMDYILLRHAGPIHKFVLYFPHYFCVDADISHWILFLSGKHVKDLTFHRESWYHKLPSCLFTCAGFENLTHLSIDYLTGESLPSTFSGFPSLLSLTVGTFVVASHDEFDKLEILISKCPLLENISLSVHGYLMDRCLSVHAPQLRSLSLDGWLSSICLEEANQIKRISLEVPWSRKANSKIEFFTCLPHLEELRLGYNFWKTNWVEEIGCAEKFKPLGEFRQLKHLKLCSVPVHWQWGLSFVLFLLQTAPSLCKLEIDLIAWAIIESLVDKVIFEGECCLSQLKYVKLCFCLRSSRIMLQLIKFILSSSPILETMIIIEDTNVKHYSTKRRLEETLKMLSITQELLEYPRASTSAQIVLKLNSTQQHESEEESM